LVASGASNAPFLTHLDMTDILNTHFIVFPLLLANDLLTKYYLILL